MSIVELSNIPIEITLGGKAYKVKRLSVADIFGKAQAKVREQYIADMKEVASALTGADKTTYLSQATKDIPKGEQLSALANDWLNSPMGMAEILYTGLSKCQEVTEDEVASAILKSSDAERNILVAYLGGSDLREASNDLPVASSVEDKKK